MTTNGDGHHEDAFELRTADGTTWLACLPLERAGFTAAFSTRSGAPAGEPLGGTSERLLSAIGKPGATLVTCRQVHGGEVRIVASSADAKGGETACDALTTATAGVLVGIKSADCVPILVVDRRTRAVAAIHAGWRGTAERIVERAFAMMIATWKTHRSDCLAAIGPSVCDACYEVGAEVVERFRDEFPYADRMVADLENGKGHLDLKLANAIQLEMCGLTDEQIFVTDYCTMCENDLFYSYRKEGARAGRILSIIGA